MAVVYDLLKMLKSNFPQTCLDRSCKTEKWMKKERKKERKIIKKKRERERGKSREKTYFQIHYKRKNYNKKTGLSPLFSEARAPDFDTLAKV